MPVHLLIVSVNGREYKAYYDLYCCSCADHAEWILHGTYLHFLTANAMGFMQYSTQPVKGDGTHFSNLYVASLLILTYTRIDSDKWECQHADDPHNTPTHRLFYQKKNTCISSFETV